jgi:hypothetical protein
MQRFSIEEIRSGFVSVPCDVISSLEPLPDDLQRKILCLYNHNPIALQCNIDMFISGLCVVPDVVDFLEKEGLSAILAKQ